MKTNYFYLQEQQTVRQRRRINKTTNAKHEVAVKQDPEEDKSGWALEGMLECFQRNSPTSACSNTAKEKFVNWEEARVFLKQH